MPSRAVRVVTALAALAAALALAPGARAQPAAEALRFVERELVHLRWGWTTVSLVKGGQERSAGFFGGKARELLADAPKALEAVESFRTYRIVGLSFYLVGLAALATDLGLLAGNASVVRAPGEVKPLGYALLAVGIGLGIPGALFMQAANSRLSDAVEHYNAVVLQRARQKWGVSLGTLPGGLAASIGTRF